MDHEYYDIKRDERLTLSQLRRRGLDKEAIELTSIGIIPLMREPGIDLDLYTVTDTGDVEIKDGVAHVVYESTPKIVQGIRRIIKDKVNAHRESILSGIDFSFDGTTHTLQTRDAVDLINWDKAQKKAMALPTDTPVEVRTAADEELLIPAGQLLTLLERLEQRRWDVMKASWAIKNDVDKAGTDAEAFAVYESQIETVWPDDSPMQL